MRLYTYFRSSAAFRVRIALNWKGLAYEPVFTHLVRGEHKSADYLAANPMGLLPALETDEGALTQSIAILEYLDEVAPEPPLLPRAAKDRAHVRAMAHIVACDIHPVNNLRILRYLKQGFGQDQDAVDNWYRHWIVEGFTGLEALVARHAGRYCFGDQVTLADICLVPQMWNARRFETPLEAFPTLVRVDGALQGLDAFAATAPQNQPDAAA